MLPISVVLALAGACSGDPRDPSKGETDSVPDTGEADADTDADADADADSDADADTDTPADGDGDGYTADVDCDDEDPAVHPGAEEVCGDEVDEDCDGEAAACPWKEVSTDDADGVIVGRWKDDRIMLAGVMDVTDSGNDEVVFHGSEDGGLQEGLYFVETPLSGIADSSDAVASVLVGGEAENLWSPVAADLDGDGTTDLAVGSIDYSGKYDPALWVLPGPIGLGETVAGATLRVNGMATGFFGHPNALGDLTGDGAVDLVTSDWYCDYVWLVPLPLAGTWDWDEVAIELDFGVAPYRDASAGSALEVTDHDGDGFDDLFVNAPGTRDTKAVSVGAVYLLLGPITADRTLSDVDAALVGENPSLFGRSLASGDTNGDGQVDLLVADFGYDGYGEASGRAWLYETRLSGRLGSDSAATAIIDGAAEETRLAHEPDVGDIDGDGVDDLVLGGYAKSEAYLFWGGISGTMTSDDAPVRLVSGEGGDQFGQRIRLGTLDGDGLADIAVDAYASDWSAEMSGAIYLFHAMHPP